MAGTNGMIGQVNIGEDSYLIGSTLFAISPATSLATDEIKVANLQNSATYVHATGITVHVKFINANEVTDSTKLKLQIGSSTPQLIRNPNGALAWAAGSTISFTNDGTYWVMNSSAIDGSSIQNLTLGQIDNEGKLNNASSLVVTNGNKEITTGVAFTSAISTQTQETTFLRSDGTWTAPSYTTNTDENVKQTPTTTNAAYELLFSESTSNDQLTEGARKTSTLKYNPSTKELTIDTGTLTGTNYSGNAATATTAAAAPWSGITGTPTTLSGYGITDALSNSSSITIAGNTVSLNNGELQAATLRNSLGLTQALRFVGSTTSEMSDGWTGTPEGISIYTGDNAIAPVLGDVVIDGNAEYVCTSVSGSTYTWELLGPESSFALDTAVIHNSLLTAAGDLIIRNATGPARLEKGSDDQVLTIDNQTHLPAWKDNSATDEKVAQQAYSTAPAASTIFNILFKNSAGDTPETAGVKFSTISGKTLTFDPYTGTLSAAMFSGALSADAIKTALGYNASTADTTLDFLHKSGNWKTLSINNTTTTIASVSGGILTLAASVRENATLVAS